MSTTTRDYYALAERSSRNAALCVIKLQTVTYHLVRGHHDQAVWRRKADELFGAVELAAEVFAGGSVDYACEILTRANQLYLT